MIIHYVGEELLIVRSRRESIMHRRRSARWLLIITHRAALTRPKTSSEGIGLSDPTNLKLVNSSGIGSAGLEDRLLRLAQKASNVANRIHHGRGGGSRSMASRPGCRGRSRSGCRGRSTGGARATGIESSPLLRQPLPVSNRLLDRSGDEVIKHTLNVWSQR